MNNLIMTSESCTKTQIVSVALDAESRNLLLVMSLKIGWYAVFHKRDSTVGSWKKMGSAWCHGRSRSAPCCLLPGLKAAEVGVTAAEVCCVWSLDNAELLRTFK